jgi:hypothetical protein
LIYEKERENNTYCFEKAKAGGHFLFFGQIAQTFIKYSIVALAHNVGAMRSVLLAENYQLNTKLSAKLTYSTCYRPFLFLA